MLHKQEKSDRISDILEQIEDLSVLYEPSKVLYKISIFDIQLRYSIFIF